MLFARKEDAERLQAVLGKRLAKFGLELHPDKTRLVDFRPSVERVDVESTLPTTFAFLGFLHIWSKTRTGKATVWQRTAKDRLARTLKAINDQCRFMRPWPLAEQHRRLCRMLEGHFAYFGITGNYPRGLRGPLDAADLAEIVVTAIVDELRHLGEVSAVG